MPNPYMNLALWPHSRKGHEALIVVTRPRKGERALVENDVNCSGLTDALAVTLVMLIESPDSSGASSAAPSTPTETEGQATVARENKREVTAIAPPRPKEMPAGSSAPKQLPASNRAVDTGAQSRKSSLTALATGTALGSVGLLSKPAAGAALGLDVFHKSGWGLTLSGLRLWTTPAERYGGSEAFTLWGGLGGPCYRQKLQASSQLQACMLLGLSQERAHAENYSNPLQKSVPWTVLGPVSVT